MAGCSWYARQETGPEASRHPGGRLQAGHTPCLLQRKFAAAAGLPAHCILPWSHGCGNLLACLPGAMTTCRRCLSTPGCGAWTYGSAAGVKCFLKQPSGWTLSPRAGLTSGTTGGAGAAGSPSPTEAGAPPAAAARPPGGLPASMPPAGESKASSGSVTQAPVMQEYTASFGLCSSRGIRRSRPALHWPQPGGGPLPRPRRQAAPAAPAVPGHPQAPAPC